eukprot:Skav219490  [mRNA]  locus=scaffold2719:297673:299089:+ [translate_table: standard]
MGATATTCYAALLRSMGTWYLDCSRSTSWTFQVRKILSAFAEAGATRSSLYASILSMLGAGLADSCRFPEAMLAFGKAGIDRAIRVAYDVHQQLGPKSAAYARLCFNMALAKQAQLEFGIEIYNDTTGKSVSMNFQDAKEAFEAAGASNCPEYRELLVHLSMLDARQDWEMTLLMLFDDFCR